MTAAAEIDRPPSRRNILWLVLSALIIALLILFAAVIPAEYGRDPTGLGQLTGTAKLFAPVEVKIPAVVGNAAAQRSEKDTPYRSDTVRIPLAAVDDPSGKNKLEYKVAMKKGAGLVYSWTVEGLPAEARNNFMTQMHGHTLEDEQTMTVVDYRLSLADHDAGTLTAAVDGIHGWYIENRARVPAVMVVKLAGFYTLVPPGKPGNEEGILAEGQAR